MAKASPKDTESYTVGVIVAERIYAGLIVDHALSGPLLCTPEANASAEEDNSLIELPTEDVFASVCDAVMKTAQGREAELRAIGIALPGMVRGGVVEEAPNLPQLKGARIQEMLAGMLAGRGITAPVVIVNDADAMAAGLASEHDKLDCMVRVWTIGTGIGYGCYPFAEGVWEGGHTVVTLDDKENFCGCGGRGHLEGIMGHRAMRLRFLDMEPEEVFEAANRRKDPDARCVDFKRLWHKALAAATASCIHQNGAGRFFLTGYNVRFLDLNLVKEYLHQMVKMSSLQGYSLEIVSDDQSTRVTGAAVAAEQVSRVPQLA